MAEAHDAAGQLLDALWPHVQAQRPILGLEPSTLLMLRDEFKMMRLGVATEQLGKLAQLFEEFRITSYNVCYTKLLRTLP